MAGSGLGEWGEAMDRERVIHAKQFWSIKVKAMEKFGYNWEKQLVDRIGPVGGFGENISKLILVFKAWSTVQCSAFLIFPQN